MFYKFYIIFVFISSIFVVTLIVYSPGHQRRNVILQKWRSSDDRSAASLVIKSIKYRERKKKEVLTIGFAYLSLVGDLPNL